MYGGKNMARILVVEDDADLNRLLCRKLINDGYDVISAVNGIDALAKTEDTGYDMVITDVMMPKMDGFELAQSIRAVNREVPIIFMTARDDKPSKMFGYGIGIDDYIVKPFDMDILLLKISAILRRVHMDAQKEIEIGNFRMNREERSAYIDGDEINLTVREFDILFKLLSYPKKTFTRSALMEEFWDYDSSATSRTVDVYMVKLREKTSRADGFEIQTVHGLGYKMVLK